MNFQESNRGGHAKVSKIQIRYQDHGEPTPVEIKVVRTGPAFLWIPGVGPVLVVAPLERRQ